MIDCYSVVIKYHTEHEVTQATYAGSEEQAKEIALRIFSTKHTEKCRYPKVDRMTKIT